jgi:hypothetical protein
VRHARCLAVVVALGAAALAPAPAAAVHNELSRSSIEGRWKTPRRTVHELLAAGYPKRVARLLGAYPRHPGIDLHDGVYEGLDLDTGRVLSTGAYTLDGDVIRLAFRRGIAISRGRPYALRWSVYRDRLTFSYLPHREVLPWFVLKPFTRVS